MRTAVRLLVPMIYVLAELWITVAATWMYVASSGRTLDAPPDAASLPGSSTLLVLGSLVDDGEPGDYVRGRLDTAITLYRSGDAERILVSGNGSGAAGNEPAVMRTYLERHGVGSESIADDPAGLDTAQSCRRTRELYGVRRVVVVTQDFHLRRAIALCRDAGLDAYGIAAECDCPSWTLVRNRVRETVFAGPRALLTAVR